MLEFTNLDVKKFELTFYNLSAFRSYVIKYFFSPEAIISFY